VRRAVVAAVAFLISAVLVAVVIACDQIIEFEYGNRQLVYPKAKP
jgi:hypothetical protein